MRLHFPKMISFATALLLAGLASSQSQSANDFYRCIARSIDAADGRVLVFPRAGLYQVSLQGEMLTWRVGGSAHATVVFHYRNHSIQEGSSIAFSPPLEIRRGSGDGDNYVRIKSVKYDGDGLATPQFVDSADRDTTPSDYTGNIATSALELNTSPESLFLGEPFKFAEQVQSIQANGQPIGTPRTLINRIEFHQDPANNVPGFAVVLRPGANITFSSLDSARRTFTNSIKISSATEPKSGFVFDKIDYFPANDYTECELAQLSMNLASANLVAGKTALVLAEGSRLTLDTVRARSVTNDERDNITATGGGLTGALTNGSRVTLEAYNLDEPATDLIIHDAQFALNDFSLHIKDGALTKIGCGGNSRLSCSLKEDSRFSLSSVGKFILRAGSVNILLDRAVWTSQNAKPDVAGSLTDLHLDAKFGTIPLTTTNIKQNPEFDNIQIDSSLLKFDTRDRAGLEGTFSRWDAHLRPGTVVYLQPGTSFLLAEGATMRAEDPGMPIHFKAETAIPLGRFHLSIPKIASGQLSAGPSLRLTSGNVDLFVENEAIGESHGYAPGQITVAAEVVTKNGRVPMAVRGSDAFLKVAGGHTSLAGTFEFALAPGLDITITTPFIKKVEGHNDMRIFPITFHVGVSQEQKLFSGLPLVIDQSGLRKADGTALQVSAPIVFSLHVPQGLGQYLDKDDVTKGKSDDDAYAHKQEVWRDDFLTSTVHLYLDPADYALNAQLNLGYDPGEAEPWQFHLDQLSFPGTLKVTEDGGGILKGIVDAWLAIVHVLPGVGDNTPHSVQDFASRIATRMLRDRLAGFSLR